MNMVDDATGTTLAQFHEQETIWGAVEVLRAWVKKYGVPRALYTDWKNVYVRPPNQEERESGQRPLTQFGRMCAALGTQIIAASSPQAKGRVERNHGTHQDRLVKKLRLKKISTRAEANAFLRQRYLPDHNRRFRRAAAAAEDLHLPAPERSALDRIFCLEQERVISNDWVIHYEGRLLQLERQSGYAPAGQKVTIREARDGSLKLYYRGQEMAWKEIPSPTPAPKPTVKPRPLPMEIRTHPKPPASHPWRSSYQTMPDGWVRRFEKRL
jgi:hypothetical protein